MGVNHSHHLSYQTKPELSLDVVVFCFFSHLSSSDVSVVTSSAGSALYGQRLFLCFLFSCFFFFCCWPLSCVGLFSAFVSYCVLCVFSFVEICPIVFHLSQIPPILQHLVPGSKTRACVARQRSTLKKLKRKKKKKKKKRRKKSHDFNLPFFSRNCQSCIHTIRMQHARALTLSPPHSFKLITTKLFPTRTYIIYLAR